MIQRFFNRKPPMARRKAKTSAATTSVGIGTDPASNTVGTTATPAAASTTAATSTTTATNTARSAVSAARADAPDLTASATMHGSRTIEDVQADIQTAIGAGNPNYQNVIIGTKPASATDPDNRYVLLSSVDTGTPGASPKKLLKATVDHVTVYRRFSESTMNPEEKAKIILKSMGIPPEEGFEMPTELVINGKSDPTDPAFAATARNGKTMAVIQEMFKIYEIEKRSYDAAHGATGAPGPTVI
jgi:antitoxin component of RelBE/YafQ-DinJ toxin-antitoxin module